jgi:regulator of protease activity HflC (stomatin/prohibitin superfamily)
MDIVVVAPPFVRIAFEAVTAAEADRNSTIARAHGEASSITNRAQGEATQILNSGKADRSQLLSAVAGEASRFNARLPEYRKNPELFRQRMLAAAMQSALTNAQEKFFLPEAAAGDRPEIRLLLNREPAKGAGTPNGP